MASHYVTPPMGGVDSSKKITLGTEAVGSDGTYKYLEGVANTKAGTAVTYNAGTFKTTLAAPGAKGPIAFAQAAVLANQFGWYLIDGSGKADGAKAIPAGAMLYMAANGTVTDTVGAGNAIANAYATNASTGVGPVDIVAHYPFAAGLG